MRYQAYNISIESRFDLRPLVAGTTDEPPDVEIVLGVVDPEGLPSATERRAFAQVGPDQVWLDVTGVARFLIEHGRRIVVDPADGADEDSIRLYLLGSGLGALLHQRGHLVLHANAVEIDGQAVLFAGRSGAGKSTTAAVFHQRGYRVIADDVVALDEQLRVIGGFPQIKLWRDALEHLGIHHEGLDRIRLQLKKYSYPIEPHTRLDLPVRAVYFLAAARENEEQEFEFHPLSGMAKFQHLKAHTYRPNFMVGLGLRAHHLRLAGQLAGNVRAARILRPGHRFNAVELADRVLEHLSESEPVASHD